MSQTKPWRSNRSGSSSSIDAGEADAHAREEESQYLGDSTSNLSMSL